MIDIRGLYKSFEDKTVLSDINGLNEMYRRLAYS